MIGYREITVRSQDIRKGDRLEGVTEVQLTGGTVYIKTDNLGSDEEFYDSEGLVLDSDVEVDILRPTNRPAPRTVSETREETDLCERGTTGCCILHTWDDGNCETY